MDTASTTMDACETQAVRVALSTMAATSVARIETTTRTSIGVANAPARRPVLMVTSASAPSTATRSGPPTC